MSLHNPAIAGVSRGARALAPAAATILALAWSLHGAPPIADSLVARMHLGTSSQVIAWGKIPDEELRAGTTQFNCFMVILLAVAASVLIVTAVDRVLSRRAPALVTAVWRVGLLIGAGVMAGRISSFAFKLALVFLAWCVALLAPHLGSGGRARGQTSSAALLTAALSVEWLSFGWTLALTVHPALGTASYLLAVAGGILGAARGASSRREGVVLDVYGYAPFLALPILGLIREPSPYWCLFLLAAIRIWRWVIRRRGWHLKWSVPTWAATVGVPFAIGAILSLPLKFRELASISHNNHEGQHMGWVNSALFGKLMFADASVIYGPLREYVLTLFCLATGVTAEHLRLAHIAVNLLGLALTMAASWPVVRGRYWLQFVFLGAILAHSQLSFMVTYRDQLSFGWVDLARFGLAALALVQAMAVVTSHETPTPAGVRFSSRSRKLAAWGLLAGLAVLYSQDYGLCAVGAVGLALAIDALVRSEGTIAARARRMLRDGAAFTAGVLAPILLLVVIYVIAGRGAKLLHAVLWTGLLASGSWSGVAYPATQHTFDATDPIVGGTAGGDGGPVVDYLAPLAICVVGLMVVIVHAVRGRWSKRTTLILTLLLFSVTAYRHGLLRADIYHLRSSGVPTLLLLIALTADAATWTLRARPRYAALPIGGAICGLVLLAWTVCGDRLHPIQKRLDEIGNGTEAPSVGPRYQYADIPRAGDMNVPPGDQAVIRYVLSTTSRRDPVLSMKDFIDGGEYNFMVARRNPTPYDNPNELLTREDQEGITKILRTDPPTIIIGDYVGILNDDSKREIAEHWQVVHVAGGSITVRRYHPPESR